MAKAQWDPEHSHFDLAFSDHEPLVLVLMDKDRFNPDDKLGEVSLPAADIKDRFGRSPEAAETSVVNGLQLTDDKGVPVAALGVSGYWLPLADDERFSKGANHNRPDAVRSKYSPARENLFFGVGRKGGDEKEKEEGWGSAAVAGCPSQPPCPSPRQTRQRRCTNSGRRSRCTLTRSRPEM